mmetsp:Transcript_15210/g.37534  ORF Transcript_15210/g.37534 Transcript_15210/m.37534 type:complete len:108 (-) Transcript_15210:4480-4803(-)
MPTKLPTAIKLLGADDKMLEIRPGYKENDLGAYQRRLHDKISGRLHDQLAPVDSIRGDVVCCRCVVCPTYHKEYSLQVHLSTTLVAADLSKRNSVIECVETVDSPLM